jgi:hypothetical protein
MNVEYFRQNNGDFESNYCYLHRTKNIISLSLKKTQLLCRKLAKIAKNSDHNTDPQDKGRIVMC